MGRKSRIVALREVLEEEKKKTLEKMYMAINTRNFLHAELYNRVVEDILNPAIELCGEEKPKEEVKENE